MENNNDKLIDYLDGAKDWLEKAKVEYNQANPVGGELILNLAQAEIKYAWELSHGNYVSDSKKHLPDCNPPDRKFKLILPIAAAFILCIGLGLWIEMGGLPRNQKVPTLGENATQVLKKPAMLTIRKQNTVTVENPLLVTTTSQPAVKPSAQPVAAIELNQSKTESKPVIDTGESERNTNQIGNTTVANQTRIKESSSIQSNPQPVSRLAIDEEALTNEASHSLRNGK